MKTLSENTPLKMSLGLIVILIGGIFWLSSLYAETTHNTTSLERIENKVDSLGDRLTRVEDKLDKELGVND
jgi:hypothetical protein